MNGKGFCLLYLRLLNLITLKETIDYMMNAVWSRNAVLYEMNLRQTTSEGTLAAAAERLGFLRDLGIDAVWLMPHYPIGEVGRKGSLGSYYSIRDYRAVNPEFGTMADFDVFVQRAHALGMKVLIDWVANHTSRDARWLAECPADWYERDASGRPVVPDGWDDTAKLDYTNRAVWQGRGRRHAFLACGTRGERFSLRYGDAGSHRILAGGGTAVAGGETRPVPAGRSRGGLPVRPSFRRVVCLAALSPDERRGAAKVPGRSYSAVFSYADREHVPTWALRLNVHFESRRELLERERIRPSGACRAGHDGPDVSAAAVAAVGLHGAGVELRPLFRLFRPGPRLLASRTKRRSSTGG